MTLFIRALLLLLFASAAFCVRGQRLVGRSVGGMGAGGLVAASLVCHAEAANPAAMALLDRLTLTAGGGLPYGLADLAEMRGAVAVPTTLVCAAARVSRSGGDYSRFVSFGVDFARRFGPVAVGVGYHGVVHSLAFADRGVSSFSNLGLLFVPSGRWEVGLSVRNVERRRLSRPGRDDTLPSTVWATLLWRAERVFSVCVEAEKEVGRDPVGRVGVALRPVGGLFFTAGFASLGEELSAGAGFDWELFGVRASIAHHSALGVSSGAALSFHPRWP